VTSNLTISAPATARHEAARILLLTLGVLTVLRYWILPLRNSFWLDESLVVMIARKPLVEVEGAAYQANQPILFAYIEWIMRNVLGPGEISMRIPSLLGAFGCAYVLYSIGKEFSNRETGRIYALVFVMLPQVMIEASNARPYMLGLFCLLLAIQSLLRWTQKRTWKQATLFAVYTAASAYLHPFFFFAAPFQFLYFAMKSDVRERRVVYQAAWSTLLCLGLLLPLAFPIGVFIARRAIIHFPAPASLSNLLDYLFLPRFAVVCTAAWAIVRSTKSFSLPNRELVLLGVLLVIPAILLFAIAKTFGYSVFVDRYLLTSIPGVILLWGSVVRGIQPGSVRRFTLFAGLLLSFATQPFQAVPDFRYEQWRTAIEHAPHTGQMLIYAGLAETRQLAWLQDPAHWAYLTSPVGVYSPDISPDRAFLIPFEFQTSDQDYMQKLLARSITGQTVTIIARSYFWAGPWLDWFAQRLRQNGYVAVRNERYGTIELHVYERGS
jgi:4-amino-4-deoxy-L-arabinose transferase-like glycosyltransferase